jgi:hypothetical protein
MLAIPETWCIGGVEVMAGGGERLANAIWRVVVRLLQMKEI